MLRSVWIIPMPSADPCPVFASCSGDTKGMRSPAFEVCLFANEGPAKGSVLW